VRRPRSGFPALHLRSSGNLRRVYASPCSDIRLSRQPRPATPPETKAGIETNNLGPSKGVALACRIAPRNGSRSPGVLFGAEVMKPHWIGAPTRKSVPSGAMPPAPDGIPLQNARSHWKRRPGSHARSGKPTYQPLCGHRLNLGKRMLHFSPRGIAAPAARAATAVDRSPPTSSGDLGEASSLERRTVRKTPSADRRLVRPGQLSWPHSFSNTHAPYRVLTAAKETARWCQVPAPRALVGKPRGLPLAHRSLPIPSDGPEPQISPSGKSPP